jgi:hypothetical protein
MNNYEQSRDPRSIIEPTPRMLRNAAPSQSPAGWEEAAVPHLAVQFTVRDGLFRQTAGNLCAVALLQDDASCLTENRDFWLLVFHCCSPPFFPLVDCAART